MQKRGEDLLFLFIVLRKSFRFHFNMLQGVMEHKAFMIILLAENVSLNPERSL